MLVPHAARIADAGREPHPRAVAGSAKDQRALVARVERALDGERALHRRATFGEVRSDDAGPARRAAHREHVVAHAQRLAREVGGQAARDEDRRCAGLEIDARHVASGGDDHGAVVEPRPATDSGEERCLRRVPAWITRAKALGDRGRDIVELAEHAARIDAERSIVVGLDPDLPGA